MNVSLTPQLEALIRKKVKSGRYHSASEVIREALRLLEDREQLRAIQLAEFRKQIAVGVAQADRGEVAHLSMAAIKAKARKRRKARR